MKKISLLFIILALSVSCRQEIKPADIAKINGYWEIDKVVLDGKTKDYKINETIDYFEITGKSGFRKKVMPQFDGKYLVNGNSESIEVVTSGDKTYLSYDSGFDKWKEEVVKVADSELVFKSADNLEYHYKKPVPFSVK